MSRSLFIYAVSQMRGKKSSNTSFNYCIAIWFASIWNHYTRISHAMLYMYMHPIKARRIRCHSVYIYIYTYDLAFALGVPAALHVLMCHVFFCCNGLRYLGLLCCVSWCDSYFNCLICLLEACWLCILFKALRMHGGKLQAHPKNSRLREVWAGLCLCQEAVGLAAWEAAW